MKRHVAVVAMIAGLWVACDSATGPPAEAPERPPYYLKAPTNSGDGQTDTVLATLALPFRVLVRRGDSPARGIPVLWEILGDTSRGIPDFATISVTDDTGIATSPFRLTLGRTPGTHAVRASVPTLIRPAPIQVFTDLPCGSALCFTAAATPASPTQFRSVSGDGQTRPINTPLAADYVVSLRDSYGNGVAGVVIDWVVTAGGGSITPSQSVTGFTGVARARATLGPSEGAQRVTATASGLPSVAPVTFTATAFDPGPVADVHGLWDWTEEYTNPVCADTGTYVFTQTGSGLSGSSLQVGVCYLSTGPIDNSRTVPDSVPTGLVVGDSITFSVAPSCVYNATVSGNPPDSMSGTTRCSNSNGTRINTGTWRAVREKAVASVVVTPGSQTVTVGASLQLAAQLADVNGHRLFFRTITWSSDNPAVASVSPAGVVLAVSAGSATITASSDGQIGTATVVVP